MVRAVFAVAFTVASFAGAGAAAAAEMPVAPMGGDGATLAVPGDSTSDVGEVGESTVVAPADTGGADATPAAGDTTSGVGVAGESAVVVPADTGGADVLGSVDGADAILAAPGDMTSSVGDVGESAVVVPADTGRADATGADAPVLVRVAGFSDGSDLDSVPVLVGVAGFSDGNGLASALPVSVSGRSTAKGPPGSGARASGFSDGNGLN